LYPRNHDEHIINWEELSIVVEKPKMQLMLKTSNSYQINLMNPEEKMNK